MENAEKILCACGCGTEMPKGKVGYNFPLIGRVCVPCYRNIVPKDKQGTVISLKYIENYIQKKQ